MPAYHFERALFVVGEPDFGKSNQLRGIFRDVRLGTGGNVPDEKEAARTISVIEREVLVSAVEFAS